MCILYLDYNRAKVFSSSLYIEALKRRRRLEIVAIDAANSHWKYADAIAALDSAHGEFAINNAFAYLAEITPPHPAWR